MIAPHPAPVAWLTTLIRECQAMAGAALERSPVLLLAQLEATLTRVPRDASGLEDSIARRVLSQTIGHVIQLARLEDMPEVGRAFISVASAATAGRWLSEFTALVYVCATSLQSSAPPGCHTCDARNWRVDRALAFIDRHFAEPTCGLGAAAARLDLTPAHLSRILTRHTGEGFVAHLRRRRVREARRLLRDSPLRVKEIATAVGYDTRRQFERDFKRLCRATPTSLRKQPATWE